MRTSQTECKLFFILFFGRHFLLIETVFLALACEKRTEWGGPLPVQGKPGCPGLPAVGLGISVPIACLQFCSARSRCCCCHAGCAGKYRVHPTASPRWDKHALGTLLNMGQNHFSLPPNVFRMTLRSGAGKYCSTVKGNDQP